MSSEDYFTLLCIPQEGIPFETIGTHRARREENIQKDSVIMDLVSREFGEEVIPSRPFLLNPQLSTYNKVWTSVEKIIEDMWVSEQPCNYISVFVSKNDHLYSYNKYVKGDNRPKGNIYIWISSEEYNRYDHPLEKKYRRPNINTWVSYEETKLNFTTKTDNISVQEYCRCYTCLKPNLSWSMANL
tara:strand:- start:1050 stop:1607 length:558 start_codon:yes stop_codon:yes gene_type:complete